MRKGHGYDLEHQPDEFINDLKTRCQQTRVPFMVEELPGNYVHRTGLFGELVELLVDDERGNPKAITAALRGAGGFGKTTMARALCRDIRARYVFFDGILWTTLGEKPDHLAGKVEDLIYALSEKRPGFADVADASNHLRALLEDKNVLLVIDDVWREADARPFLVGGKGCAWLLTTRNRDTLPRDSEEINVDEMEAAEAVQLLGAGLPFEDEPDAFAKLAARLGEWPLLLNLVNRVLLDRVHRRGQPLPDALAYANTRLDRKGLRAFDRGDETARDLAVARTIGVSLDLLTPDEQTRLEELAVFPEDVNSPVATVARLWGQTASLDEFDAEELCNRFFDLSLLLAYDLTAQTIRLHDVVRAYLRGRIGMDRLRELDGVLVDAHGYDDPAAMPADEPYLWRYLALHLADAGRREALRDLVVRFDWIQAKLAATDILALLDDYQHLDDEADARAVGQALRLSAHVLAADETQLACQLYGRLLPLESEGAQVLREGIAQAQSSPWLRALNPALTPPGGSELQTFSGHQDWVNAVAITPDGTRAVSASWDKTLKVWDLTTGIEQQTLSGHQSLVTAVAITPDGTRAVSASWDQTLKVWDLTTGTEQ
ncbi:MAG: NB-ARC domain-containing protein, partial [Rhodothermales bacterium]